MSNLESEISKVITKVQEGNPLIHNITNIVVANFTANGLLALGASPVMADAREEVADMAKIAGALVLNLGTISSQQVEVMIKAGQSANAHGVPVVLDPVGAGATPYRTETALRVLREVKVSLIRGNAAEVAFLVGEAREIKGVDAGASDSKENTELAVRAARQFGAVVAITAEEDVITDGVTCRIIQGGDALLTQVTGTGCLLTSVLGAFAAVEKDVLLAGTAGLAFYGAAASRAAERAGTAGPGSFQVAFLDELSKLHPHSLKGYTTIQEVQPSSAGGAKL